jgi:predicted nucleic acid-binding protein
VDRFIIDSDILSYVLQKREGVVTRLAEAVRSRVQIFLCPMVYYQVRRGLLHKGAEGRLREFHAIAIGLTWAEFERPMWDDAAELWAECRRRSEPGDDDADLLIAAYARHLQATLVTNNISDFEHLGVRLANWLA